MEYNKTQLEPACFYLRKSRKDQEAEARHEGETLAKHRTALLKLAQKYNVNITHIYEEIVSGESIIHRPQMIELLKDIEAGKWRSVFCMDIARLGRGDMRDQGILLDTFKNNKILIVTPRKIYNLEDEFDEEFTEFESFMVRKELKLINRRMQSGRRRSIEAGNFISPLPPFGYKVATDESKNRRYLVKDENTREIIELIFCLLTDDYRSSKIANHLNELGYKSPKGILWQPTSVRSLLRNPVYAGVVTWGKKDEKKNPTGGKTVRKRPREQQIWTHNSHEGYISFERWEEIQKLINLRTHPQYYKSLTNPLAGLIICQKCGKRMVYRPYTNRPPYICCYDSNCNNKSSRFEYVEARLLETLGEWVAITKQKIISTKKEKSIDSATIEKKTLKKLENELSEVEKQKDTLHDLLEKGVYDIDIFIERSNKLKTKIDEITSNIKAVKSKYSAEKKSVKLKKDFIPKVEKVILNYSKSKSIDEKNELLKSILSHVNYIKEKDWKPDEFTLTLSLLDS